MDHVGRAPAGQSRLLQGRARVIRRRSCSRSSAPAGISRSTIRRRKKLTHISTCFGTHHLMFAEDANNTLWTSGGGQVVGWLNTKMFDETGDEVKSQGWTRAHHRHQRQRQARRVRRAEPAGRSRRRTSGSTAASTPCRPRPTDRSGARSLGFPGAVVRLVPGSNPPETALAEVYEPPVEQSEGAGAGLLAARRWTSIATASSGWRSRAATGELRSPQVQGSAQRADGDRPALPRGLDALPGAAAAVQGRDRLAAAPRRATTRGSISSTRSGSARNMPINTGNASEGLLALKDGKWVVLRVPYPTRLLHEVAGRPHRRSERRLEGPRAVGDRSARARRSTWRAARARRARSMKFQLRPDPLAK